MEKNLVSIIIPCYNGETFLHNLFRTFARQTYKKQQIIFVNDGSVDMTGKIALNYQKYFRKQGIQFVYLYQFNQGQAAAVNHAIPYIKGEYCMWFDADDYMTEDHIDKKVSFLQSHPDIDLVMCRGCVIDGETNQKIQDLGYEIPVGTLFEDILFEYRRCTPGLYMVRTKTLLSSLRDGQIYEARVGQNFQLLLPITRKGNSGYLEEMLFYYVYRENSHSRSFHTSSDFIKRLDDLEDVRLHVINELNLEDNYKRKLIYYIKQFMLMQRIEELGINIPFDCYSFIDIVRKRFLQFSEISIYLNNRDIYLWGACTISDQIRKMLEQHLEYVIKGYIDNNRNKVNLMRDSLEIYGAEILDSERMYIIIPLKVHDDILRKLQERGFEEKKDYYYPENELRKFLENKGYADF